MLLLLIAIIYVCLIVFIVRDAGYMDEWGNFYSCKDWKHICRMDKQYD